MNLIFPIVFFCAVVHGQPSRCDGQTALLHHELDAVNTPMSCLLEGTADATNYIVQFEKEHPSKKLEYRILCKSSEKT